MTDEHSNKKEATVESTNATPGQELRKGREAMGLTQQQVADRLHLRLNDIQDIEADISKPGVSITFTKGYVRIYAKLLGMVAEPLLEAFDVLHHGEKQPAKLQSFSQRVAKQANDDRWMMVTYLIVFLVLASLVIWWFQQADSDDKSLMDRFSWFSSVESEQVAEEGELVSVLNDNDTLEELPNANLPDELAVPESAFDGLIEQPNSAQDEVEQNADDISDSMSQNVNDAQDNVVELADQVNDELLSSMNETATTIEDADELATIDAPVVEVSRESFGDIGDYQMYDNGTVDVVFTFSEDCWLQVTDATSDVKAVGVKVKGRVMPITGVPPISVNMCPPEYVQINFAGKDVDLSSYTRGVPVKFELSVTGE
ncbi:DUF4115 domain-containing protein [Glaciecola sp. MH2013]|uniref:RodZ domain-containing protein n=1 Tax=Glaciecola sp. MH2013 TaxID=2785524 RepID=UPI00189CD200|nr:RodZ domain-containing protein [Glaciecola sp. MH2013]MBF7074788.1 DUF4115 domain-containing protein [Glaciecola sp. MH2013]